MASARDIQNRSLITFGLIIATVMNTLDTTIANIALPHMRGTFSATQDQMVWVLTSYIVASVITTPLTGWLTGRFGRRFLFLASILGFTIASMLCGSATSLAEMVVFRVFQGVFGASMIPLSQSVMLDLYPAKQLGQAMAIWGAGTTLGPVFGPLLGGWLTDNFSWRWVFYINVPVGVVAFAVIWIFMSPDPGAKGRRLDFLGFGALTFFIAGLQLMLDRGPTQDWFSSPEVWTEAICAGTGLYLFTVQMLTARRPFIDRALFFDWNFLACNILVIISQMLLFSTMALQPPLMQELMGYPVLGAALVMMPRGVGVLISMTVAGRLVGKVDTRILLLAGFLLSAVSMFQMSHFDLSMTSAAFVVSGLLQGLGLPLIFVPTTTVAFSTLDRSLRPDATATFGLLRSLGQSIGISLMEALYTHQATVAYSDLAAKVQPSSPWFEAGVPAAINPASLGGMRTLSDEITRQASMVGYVDVFHLLFFGVLAVTPLVFLLNPLKRSGRPSSVAIE